MMDSNLLDSYGRNGNGGHPSGGHPPPPHPPPGLQQQQQPGGSSHGYHNPQSPIDLKPDANALLTSLTNSALGGDGPSSSSPKSPTTSNSFINNLNFGSPGSTTSSTGRPLSPPSHPGAPGSSNNLTPVNNYPPNHPLSGSKHFCSICGDRASGKHYGVYSCEGCKGFFKRTVRKELTYACRENRDCIIDKRQRNRCQYCRYMKCLQTGMRREAVQEERHRGSSGGAAGNSSSKNDNEVESTSGGNGEMPIERIVHAEDISEVKEDGDESAGPSPTPAGLDSNNRDLERFGKARQKIVKQLIEWAKNIPHFTELKVEDQITLIRAGWNELLISGFSFRSTKLNDGILLGNGTIVSRENAHAAGVGNIFDRVLVELVSKMKEMNMDKAELGCLRAIVLFNPDAKGLSDVNKVESLREKVYATLEEYTRSAHENEPSRFAKLLLRLPALRSIGLKCIEHLFFYKLIGENQDGNPLEQFIQSILEDS